MWDSVILAFGNMEVILYLIYCVLTRLCAYGTILAFENNGSGMVMYRPGEMEFEKE
jgi:hypothetical protein